VGAAGLLAGCGGGKAIGASLAHDAGGLAKGITHDAIHLPDGGLQLQSGTKIHLPSDTGPVDVAVQKQAQQMIAAHASELDAAETKELVEAACFAKNLVDVGSATSWDDAAMRAYEHFGGDAAVHARVQAMAEDIAAADNPYDAVGALAVEAMCEAAEKSG
jgi:hypothetical protein